MFATRLHHKATTTLHLLLLPLVGIVVALSTTSVGARTMAAPFLPTCNFQEVSLAPCMAGASCGGGGNISGACCSSLNSALDAGHRCVCTLLLANPVFASLVTNLLTLPLMLPLPGCFLYAPSLAACQGQVPATVIQQQTNAPPTATPTVAIANTGAAAGVADPPTTTLATALTPSQEKSAGSEKADGGRVNATTAAVAGGDATSRSNACHRHQGGSAPGQGTAYALTFLTAVAVSWINCLTVP